MRNRGRVYRNKADWILASLEGERILYVGSVDENLENLRKHRAMHRLLATRVDDLVGVYGSREQATALTESGLHAVCADAEDLDLGRTFDTIVCSDVIEHLSNCGSFLTGVERHLAPGGCALVSTPNPTSFVRILQLLARGKTSANVEHSCWYTGQVLDQVARRHGLRLASEARIDDMAHYFGASPGMPFSRRVVARLVVGMNRVCCALLPQLSETFGFVLRKTAERGDRPRIVAFDG